MSRITSFRIGGPADLLVTASNYNDVISVKQICESQSIPLTYMGNGSNMLVSDKGVDGIVLRMDSKQATGDRKRSCSLFGRCLLKNFVLFQRMQGCRV